MKLQDIGFYTLTDERARDVAKCGYTAKCAADRITVPLQRCEMILTDRCNFKCEYCRGVKPQLRGDIPISQAIRILGLWMQSGLKNIRFSGGEPTLYQGLVELLWYAQRSGCERIAISTNGSAPLAQYKELITEGVNDISISLDACCAATTDIMSGVKDQFNTIISNIRELSKLTYVTVGIVVTEHNLGELRRTIKLAQELGVSDIRVIPAAQFSSKLEPLPMLEGCPILKYRWSHRRPVRGMWETDCPTCHLVVDDMAVAQKWHFPCIIYLREGGQPIGEVGPFMRQERVQWLLKHNSHTDPICRHNCLDVCIEYNNRVEEFKGGIIQ